MSKLFEGLLGLLKGGVEAFTRLDEVYVGDQSLKREARLEAEQELKL